MHSSLRPGQPLFSPRHWSRTLPPVPSHSTHPWQCSPRLVGCRAALQSGIRSVHSGSSPHFEPVLAPHAGGRVNTQLSLSFYHSPVCTKQLLGNNNPNQSAVPPAHPRCHHHHHHLRHGSHCWASPRDLLPLIKCQFRLAALSASCLCFCVVSRSFVDGCFGAEPHR